MLRLLRFPILLAVFLLATQSAHSAGLLLLDFGTRTGEAEGWDIIDEVVADEECNYLDDEFTPCTVFELTDRAGSDNDITLEVLEQPFIGNTAPHLETDQVYDGLGVPVAALGDYQYRDPDTADSSAPFRFSNIDPGTYRVTVFEGRTNDGNGQFAKLWVGDFNGSNEPGVMGEHEGKNTSDFAAGSSTTVLEIAEGDYLWYRHLEDNSGGISGMIIRPENAEPLPVEGTAMVGSSLVSSVRGNFVFSEPGTEYAEGLGQYWYAVGNPGSRSGVNAIIGTNEPAVPYFQAEGTWWTGSSDSVETLSAYPDQVVDADPLPFEGDTGNINQYTVRLAGQIKIDESGTIRFLDGIDDYTYVAIDVDGSGKAGDADGEILIDDNDWTNVLSTTNGGAPIVEVEFTDIPAGGAWREIEFFMAEGGGGDSGILYWDANDEDEIFPQEKGEGLFDAIDAEALVIPDLNLRSPTTPQTLLSAEASGIVPESPTGWEIDVNPADGTSDSFAVENPDEALYTTILDVNGAVLHVNTLGDVAPGTSFQVFLADQVVGDLTIATEGWNFDPSTGSIVFGEVSACNAETQGDLDLNGRVEFADFLILSNNFGMDGGSHTVGDIDCNGAVDFADFLVLSNNFGSAVGASAVPEPSAFALALPGLLCLGLVRRRRCRHFYS